MSSRIGLEFSKSDLLSEFQLCKQQCLNKMQNSKYFKIFILLPYPSSL